VTAGGALLVSAHKMTAVGTRNPYSATLSPDLAKLGAPRGSPHRLGHGAVALKCSEPGRVVPTFTCTSLAITFDGGMFKVESALTADSFYNSVGYALFIRSYERTFRPFRGLVRARNDS
jgi:hypothetical protein